MSAFVVSDNHILVLVEAARRYTWDREKPETIHRGVENWQEIVDILIAENYRSVNHRYPHQAEPHKIQYKPMSTFSFTPVDILKACDCYDYQACETNDYRQTQAAKIIDRIRAMAISKLPGYDKAPWRIN